jgi:hypothetical protein
MYKKINTSAINVAAMRTYWSVMKYAPRSILVLLFLPIVTL